jgi:hypothetical protein
MLFKTLELVKSHKRKLGIISQDWGPTDRDFYAINFANKLIAEADIDVTGFYQDSPNPVIPCNFGLMNIQDIWGFDGLTIATNIEQAIALSKVVGTHKKLFYVYDLEYLRPGKQNFLYNLQAYRSNNLELVCRSEEHKNALQKYCNRKIEHVIEDFNLFEFWKLFGENNGD